MRNIFPIPFYCPQRTNHPYGPDASSRNVLSLTATQSATAQSQRPSAFPKRPMGRLGSQRADRWGPMRPAKLPAHYVKRTRRGSPSRATRPSLIDSPDIDRNGPPREAAPTTYGKAFQ